MIPLTSSSKKPYRRRMFNCVRLEDRTVPATMYAVDTANNLFSFDSATPGTVSANVPITGLQANEVIHGIDTRPANLQLYGLGLVDDGATRTGRIYAINPVTGAATQVGATPFSTTLADNNFWGFDFNPNVDLIRIVNHAEQNLRVNPNTGALVSTDTSLNPTGQRIEALAYTNSAGFMTATTLYGLSFTNDTLVTIGGLNGTPSPNTGQIFEVGSLGIVNNGDYQFDIEAGTEIGRLSARVSGSTNLYTVDLATGVATLVGAIGNGSVLLRGLTTVSTAITVGGTSGDDTVVVNATGANSGSYTLNGGTPVSFSGITSFSFIAGAGSDKLTINTPTGNLFAPDNGIFYHAGGDTSDVLEVLGGTANTGDFKPGGAAGSGTLTHSGFTSTQTIEITGITAITDTTSEANFNINGTPGADTFSLAPNVVQGGVQLSQVKETPAGLSQIAILYGDKPVTNVIGDNGDDLFILNGTSNLTNLNGGDDSDTLQFSNALALATLSGGSFDGGAGTDFIDYGPTPIGVRVNLGLSNNMTVEMDGTQENPATTSTATASGTLTYNPANRQVSIVLTVNNMFNTILDFHIHLNPTGVNGSIIVPIGAGVFMPTAVPGQFTVNTNVTLPEINEAALLGGHTYLNIHTIVVQSGEIRGQIMPGANVNLVTNGFASGLATISNVENAIGTGSDDSLVGSFSANKIDGVGGNDIIVGGPGADTISGGLGNDVLVWNNGDGSDVMDGGNDADTVQVNGGSATEVFTVTDGSNRATFNRLTPAPFSLDIGTTESLRLNANVGDDTFTVTSLTTIISGIATVQGFGMNGNDSFVIVDSTLSGGARFNGHLGTNSLIMTDSNVSAAVSNNNGIVGNGLLGEFLATVELNNSTFNNNAQNGVRLSDVGDVNLTDLTTTGNTGFGVSVGTATNVGIGGPAPAQLTVESGIQLIGPLTYEAQVNGPLAGTDYDQIVASNVSLGDATLSFQLGFMPSVGQSFTLIDNTGTNPISGTFAGLPEGSLFANNKQLFRISYAGGTGNDVVITAVESPTITSPNTATFTINTVGSFTVTTTGIPIPVITETGALPAGLMFTDNGNGTATITGTPTQFGSFPLTLTASNGVTPDAMQSFTLNVNAPPVFTSPTSFTVGRGQQFTFNVTTTGFPPASVTISGGLPSGVTYVNNNDGTGTLSGKTSESGTFDLSFNADNGVGPTVVQSFKLIITEKLFAVGPGAGRVPEVKLFAADGTPRFTFLAYDQRFTGGVTVATADFNNDGVDDVVTGAASNGGPHVKVFDGRNLNQLASFFAYDASFTGGIFVAAGDVNNDGQVDIITGANAGGGPHVKAFSGTNLFELRSFFAYNAAFRGGVRVAGGDVNNDGNDDIITGAGAGGGPHVEAFSGGNGSLLRSFFAYDAGFTGGVYVASGDNNGDGIDDIITGAGAGGGPHVQVFNGLNLALLQSFFAYNPAFTGGVRVGAEQLNGDGRADILTGAGPGGGPHVEAFSGGNLDLLQSFFAYDPTFMGGVYVG